LKSKIKSFINNLVQRYGYNLVLSGTYKKLLSAQVLAEARPSLLFQVDPIFQSSYAKEALSNKPKWTGLNLDLLVVNRFRSD